jgi:hypothetical protein
MSVPWFGVLALLLLAARTGVVLLVAMVSVFAKDPDRRGAAYRVLSVLVSRKSSQGGSG